MAIVINFEKDDWTGEDGQLFINNDDKLLIMGMPAPWDKWGMEQERTWMKISQDDGGRVFSGKKSKGEWSFSINGITRCDKSAAVAFARVLWNITDSLQVGETTVSKILMREVYT